MEKDVLFRGPSTVDTFLTQDLGSIVSPHQQLVFATSQPATQPDLAPAIKLQVRQISFKATLTKATIMTLPYRYAIPCFPLASANQSRSGQCCSELRGCESFGRAHEPEPPHILELSRWSAFCATTEAILNGSRARLHEFTRHGLEARG